MIMLIYIYATGEYIYIESPKCEKPKTQIFQTNVRY